MGNKTTIPFIVACQYACMDNMVQEILNNHKFHRGIISTPILSYKMDGGKLLGSINCRNSYVHSL
jgi:hypothetical protein